LGCVSNIIIRDGVKGNIRDMAATKSALPVVGITMGDPVGVGPEIIVRALSSPLLYGICRPLVIGDVRVLVDTARWLGIKVRCRSIEKHGEAAYEYGAIDVLNLSGLEPEKLRWGRPSTATGAAMVKYIIRAIDLAMEGSINAMTTAPINKLAMRKAGFDFDGHTEILAQRTKTTDYVMMLAGETLRVTLVTIHCALSEVPGRLTSGKIFDVIRLTEEALRQRFGIKAPRIAVAALNPHAGESGLFGDEESRIIFPAVQRARDAGMNITDPIPCDTLFCYAQKGDYDAVVCMYHDQGLIPFKMLHFSDGVNLTLGLPIIRTSCDHGTAYDIAGKGEAAPESLVAAVRMAAEHAKIRMGALA
jgi:4-hydroxythreonine-4-phosphate dehydrogenase